MGLGMALNCSTSAAVMIQRSPIFSPKRPSEQYLRTRLSWMPRISAASPVVRSLSVAMFMPLWYRERDT